MKKQNLTLAGVPAILYGERSRKVYLYVHGKNGCKEEAERFANTACAAGWQVLAIDLPEHGARRDRPEQLLPWAVVPEIQAVYARMQPVCRISGSMGSASGHGWLCRHCGQKSWKRPCSCPRWWIWKPLS